MKSAPTRSARHRNWSVATLSVALGFVAGCSGDAALPAAVEVEAVTVPVAEAPAQPECTAAEADLDPTRSYDPTEPLPNPGEMPTGTSMAKIQDRGRLIVGVSADTLQFGARDPITGIIEGFDIDILTEVNKAIFGENPPPMEFRVMTYAQRLPSLENEDVDLVAHTMTINCNRWLRIAFSTEYYRAGQKVLVKRDTVSSVDDLEPGARVCVVAGGTAFELVTTDPNYGALEVVDRADITDCLVEFQQGSVDAIISDDTVLVGFAAQDPYAEVVGDPFSEEPYGIGVNTNQVDLVQFVNGVLGEIRANGRWSEIHEQWVGSPPDGPLVGAPPAVYGREPVQG